MDLTLELRQGGVFPEDEWTKQIDGKVRDITNSAAASRSTQTDDALRATSAPPPPPPPPRQSKRPATTSAGGGVVSRDKLAMERAVKATLGGKIMNAFVCYRQRHAGELQYCIVCGNYQEKMKLRDFDI